MERTNYATGLTKYWWIPLLTGLAFIGFGAWILGDPSQSLPIVAYIFAGVIIAIGLFNVFYGISNTDSQHSYGLAMAAGVIEIILGVFIFWFPGEGLASAFAYAMGVYFIFMSVYSFFEVVTGPRPTSFLFWMLLLFLLATLVFSIWFILGPAGIAMTGWIYLGVSFLCYGVYRILVSCKLRQLNESLKNR